jgi:hypothetical protein
MERSTPSITSGSEPRSITVTDVGLLFFAMVANVVIIILAFDLVALFTPFRVATLATFFTFLLVRAAGFGRLARDGRLSWWLLGAVVSGLFVAGHLAPHYVGGQDQGYYTAIAEMLARGDPIAFIDRFRASLPADLRQTYDAMKIWGVEDRSNGTQVLQFYSLHPALMAVATQLLGKGYHTAFMLLCFAVNILAIYLLTFEISRGAWRLAALAAWLVALNPAYVFFAKFPVTEITAATLVALSLYFLLMGYRAQTRSSMILYGIGAVLFMNAFCFVRMSFPEIAPFLMLLSAVLFFIPDIRWDQKTFALLFVVASFGCYGISMIYYHAIMPQLFWAIVGGVYLPALRRARWLIGFGLAGGLLLLVALAWPVTRVKALAFVRACLRFCERTIVTFPGIVLLIVALPSIGFLVRTGAFDAFTPGDARPGPHMIRFSAVYVLMEFISPFLFVLLLTVMRPPLVADRAKLLPSLFLVTAWPVYMTFASSIPYLYYYGRYLLPEILPAAIITTVLAADSGRLPRRVAMGLASLALIYFAFFSLVQFQHSEGEVGRPFHQIADRLSPDDVLVVDGAHFIEGVRSQVVIPLRYAFGLSTFIMPPGSLQDRLSIFDRLRIVTRGQIYFLSRPDLAAASDLKRAGIEEIDKIPFKFAFLRSDTEQFPLGGWLLPRRFVRGSYPDLVLHKVSRRFSFITLLGQKIAMSETGLGQLLVRKGWSGQEPNSR